MSMLSDTVHKFAEEFYLTPLMAAEIECYVLLADESQEMIESFWGQVEKAFRHEGLPILRIEKERGFNQYEIITRVMMPEQLAYTLQSIRATIDKYARRNGVAAYFDAKPFADQPSSGLHLHLHLADGEGLNAYHKPPDWMSDALRFSLGGLLATMGEAMPSFFPNAADYARLEDTDHVPKIFGWGVNNRYCALRIPMSPDPFDKRIEHRVPCANADPVFAIWAMLTGVLKGMRERIEPSPQEYGKRGVGILEGIADYRLQAAASPPTKVLNEEISPFIS
jgi:glutamine synthetase